MRVKLVMKTPERFNRGLCYIEIQLFITTSIKRRESDDIMLADNRYIYIYI